MPPVTSSQKKAKLSRKWFARLANSDIMEKTFKSIERDMDSLDLDRAKLANDKLFKILPYIMPRESSGTSLVNIQNNTLINGKGGDKVLLTLDKFMADRDKRILQLEKRNQELQAPQTIPLKEVKTVKLKMPANSPLNKEST